MATTHNARRRQRTHRTATSHSRTVGTRSRTRQNRAVAAPVVTPSPAPVVVPEIVEAPVKVTKQIRTPDADDHLAAYFRQLAEHELLSPEDERELSQGIED